MLGRRFAIRLALQLCPRGFRDRYGVDIAAAFDEHPSLSELSNVITEGIGMRLEAIGLSLLLAVRSLRRSWLAAVVAVAAIAFGMGANVSGAAILSAAFLHPLPVPDAQQVYFASEPTGMTYADGRTLASAALPYGAIALSEADHETFAVAGRNIVLAGARVEPTYFSVLRVRPVLGTFFGDHEPVSSVVISERFWRETFGGADVIGTSMVLGGRAYQIIGIAPADFRGLPQYDSDAAYWLPISGLQPELANDASFTAVIRTKAALSPVAASGAIAKILQSIEEAHQRNPPCCVSVIPAQAGALLRLGPLLEIIYTVTWITLLIGCINVANLELARTLNSSSQRAVRAALGATPGQINVEIIAEVMLLSAVGCLFGLLIAWGTLRLLSGALPVLADATITPGIIAYAIGLVAITTAMIAAVPCAAQARAGLATMLKGIGKSSEGRRGRRSIGGLVFVQVLLTAMLVLTCVAALSAFARAQNASVGFRTEGLYVAAIDVSQRVSDSAPVEVGEAYERRTAAALVVALHRDPDVLAATVATQAPFFCCVERNFSIPNGPSDVMVRYAAVTPEYFSTLGQPILMGRAFTVADDERQPGVAIVNTSFAQRYYGKTNVLGERLIRRASYRIVGVVPPAQQEYGTQARPMVYLPMAQYPRIGYALLRTNGHVGDVARIVVEAVHSVDSSLPAPVVYSYGEVMGMRALPSIAGSWTILMFSVVALALALSGVYAIAAFSSQLRQNEFAIRAALGATRSSLLIEATRRPLVLTFSAIVIGSLMSIGLTAMLSAALSEELASTAVSVVVTFGGLAGCVIVATLLPALRSLRTSPAALLRSE